jgi:hypothetical protein
MEVKVECDGTPGGAQVTTEFLWTQVFSESAWGSRADAGRRLLE